MISQPIERRGMLGYVLRYVAVDTFKLAVVVGYEPADKTFRVRLWRAATKQWTKSRTRARLDELTPLTADERRERRATIAAAFSAAEGLGLRPYA